MDNTVWNWLGNLFSFGTLAGALTGLLPPLAAIVTLAWVVIQICESKTVQQWLASRRERQIIYYKKEILRIEAQQAIRRAMDTAAAEAKVRNVIAELAAKGATAKVGEVVIIPPLAPPANLPKIQ